MKALNFYEILGVAPDATPAQIRAAFREAAKKWHPDRHAGEHPKREATQQMQQINAAHDVLKDAAKRQKYDLRLTQPPTIRTPNTPRTRSERATAAANVPTSPPSARRPRSSWQYAAPREAAANVPRETPPTPEEMRNAARELASALRFERADAAVKTHFDNLIRRYPEQRAKLLATLKWQMNKQDSAVRRGYEAGQSEAASLSRWVLEAKRAGNNRVETPKSGPRDPNRPQPKAPPTTPLDETVVADVKAYFEDLTRQHPLDKGPLRAALDWQLTRKRVEIARLIRAGQSESVALGHWADEARRAADKQIKKR